MSASPSVFVGPSKLESMTSKVIWYSSRVRVVDR